MPTLVPILPQKQRAIFHLPDQVRMALALMGSCGKRNRSVPCCCRGHEQFTPLLGKASRVSMTARRWAQFTGGVGNQAAALLGSQSRDKKLLPLNTKEFVGKLLSKKMVTWTPPLLAHVPEPGPGTSRSPCRGGTGRICFSSCLVGCSSWNFRQQTGEPVTYCQRSASVKLTVPASALLHFVEGSSRTDGHCCPL